MVGLFLTRLLLFFLIDHSFSIPIPTREMVSHSRGGGSLVPKSYKFAHDIFVLQSRLRRILKQEMPDLFSTTLE